jgi:predicted enzyme related to lactoylglutathione lyase
MTKIAHFEITSPNPEDTAKFYSTVFGWPVTNSQFMPDYYLMELRDNEGGAVMDRKYQAQPTIIWFEVDDIDAHVRAITNAGGKAVNEKQSMPGVGHLIYVADPAGTIFGLKQPE